MQHTITYKGVPYTVNARTHVDDHSSDDDWIKTNQAAISTAIGIAQLALSAASIIITHKPRR